MRLWPNRKPYSVSIVGRYSGNVSPPLGWLRFRTIGEAQAWIDQMPDHGDSAMTDYVVVDTREKLDTQSRTQRT